MSLPVEPLWYKDAIVYQVHVKSFRDSNGDGVGDFAGLTSKLDYIQSLGVTAIWTLPFFPSPLRDDGYDIADYYNVNPSYGTLDDFRRFLDAAHDRGLRVITELVMNHTSDQHEWFQKSRRDKPGGEWRDFYVWNDDPEKYAGTRIIFQDFEASNWTWDPVANAYFWHRFYSHQPDLNFDNPAVKEAMIDVFDFWLAMGVDGLRLDAIPYLFEREGTNCENLPETHALLKELRAHVDERYEDKMLLAEANQWPEDAAAYFGDDDECHMNFHFPLMPRLFMSVQREDRFPIIDILDQTPAIGPKSQWAIFLRNHDELTLEMVTDEERDYMYRAYAEDRQARINLGIRRRLAPLLKNDRRKIELLNALLLSLPGTPIVYYGDEIGMGDNFYLGDRNGVRTPMQWNADRNAGFSDANPQKLYLPTIIDSEYHYATRNVEVEENSPHSLLWWMRRIINVRKQHPVFGTGDISFLTPENGKVLAFLRHDKVDSEGEENDEGEAPNNAILVVANLSRFPQAVELDLHEFRGRRPVELFGQVKFPAVGELPYFLTLGPHAFYWFELKWSDARAVEMAPDSLTSIKLSSVEWAKTFEGSAKSKVEAELPAYMRRHRWFGGKARTLQSVSLVDALPINTPAPDTEESPIFLLATSVEYTEGEPERYLLPVVFAGEQQAADITGDHPGAALLTVTNSEDETRTLCEACYEEEFWSPLLSLIGGGSKLPGKAGVLSGTKTAALGNHLPEEPSTPHVHGGEQSNTSGVFGTDVILKLFRRVTDGENPDWEIGRALADIPAPVPECCGALEYKAKKSGETITFGILHQFQSNEGDAWVFTLDELSRFADRVLTSDADPHEHLAAIEGVHLLELATQEVPEAVADEIGPALSEAALLGTRTAEMHVALAKVASEKFAPEAFTELYQRSLYQSLRTQVRRTMDVIRRQLHGFPADLEQKAEKVTGLESDILEVYRRLTTEKFDAQRIRVHGDYHLGQVLWTGKDFAIIDFEGEPDRPVGERRIKVSPFKDVAGMVRSYHYASHAVMHGQAPGVVIGGEQAESTAEWLKLWYAWTASRFLKAWLTGIESAKVIPSDDDQRRTLLDAYLLEKAIYELTYELNNRPDWLDIPLEGIVSLL